MPEAWIHPCLTCGACCATFRVSFYWQETEPGFSTWTVPKSKTEAISQIHLAMKGTNKSHPRCECLDGELGSLASCKIYENRPSPCRNFTASFENGERNSRCDQARIGIGLAPLKPHSWEQKSL